MIFTKANVTLSGTGRSGIPRPFSSVWYDIRRRVMWALCMGVTLRNLKHGLLRIWVPNVRSLGRRTILSGEYHFPLRHNPHLMTFEVSGAYDVGVVSVDEFACVTLRIIRCDCYSLYPSCRIHFFRHKSRVRY